MQRCERGLSKLCGQGSVMTKRQVLGGLEGQSAKHEGRGGCQRYPLGPIQNCWNGTELISDMSVIHFSLVNSSLPVL